MSCPTIYRNKPEYTRIYGKTGFEEDRQTVWEFEKIYLKLISIENHLSINSKTAIPGLNDIKCRRVTVTVKEKWKGNICRIS